MTEIKLPKEEKAREIMVIKHKGFLLQQQQQKAGI